MYMSVGLAALCVPRFDLLRVTLWLGQNRVEIPIRVVTIIIIAGSLVGIYIYISNTIKNT